MLRSSFASICSTLLICASLTATAHAGDKQAAVGADDTQRTYTRKAAIAVSDLGLQKATITLPAELCKPAGKKTKCAAIPGGWTFPISPILEAKLSDEIFGWLVTQRLDKIQVQGSAITLRTAGTKQQLRVQHVGGFAFGVGEHQAFVAAADKWLNGRVAKLVGQILAEGVKARYAEMPDRERGTFIQSRAKRLGVPAVMVEKLMNSAYAFLAYFETPTGSGRLTVGTRKVVRNGKIVEVPSFTATVTLATKVRASIYNFAAKERRFLPYSELSGESGTGVSASRSFPTMPNAAQILPVFDESLLVSTRASGINLNTRLKYDDNFAIFFTADSVEGADVGADVGVLEDIRVDAPGVVYRDVDGEKVLVGFMKARDVSLNCADRQPTTFSLVSGESEMGDQVREHPWTGLMLTGSAGMTSYSLTSWDKKAATGGGGFVSVLAGLELDLGYAMNKRWLSEVWLDMSGGIGFGGDGFSSHNDAAPLLIRFDVGARKRLYLGSSSVYLAPGVDAGLLAMSATDGDDTQSVSSLSITPVAQLGYNISPNIELTAEFGWGLALSQSGSLKVGDNDAREVEVEATGGFQAGLRLSFHSPVVGPIARLYSKPSTVCEAVDSSIAGKPGKAPAGIRSAGRASPGKRGPVRSKHKRAPPEPPAAIDTGHREAVAAVKPVAVVKPVASTPPPAEEDEPSAPVPAVAAAPAKVAPPPPPVAAIVPSPANPAAVPTVAVGPARDVEQPSVAAAATPAPPSPAEADAPPPPPPVIDVVSAELDVPANQSAAEPPRRTDSALQARALKLSKRAERLEQAGDFAVAAEMWAVAFELDGTNWNYLYRTGRCEQRAGMLERAKASYGRFVREAPTEHVDGPEVQRHLAELTPKPAARHAPPAPVVTTDAAPDVYARAAPAESAGSGAWKWIASGVFLVGGGAVAYLGVIRSEQAQEGVRSGKFGDDYLAYERDHNFATTLYYVGMGSVGAGALTALWATMSSSDDEVAALPRLQPSLIAAGRRTQLALSYSF